MLFLLYNKQYFHNTDIEKKLPQVKGNLTQPSQHQGEKENIYDLCEN